MEFQGQDEVMQKLAAVSNRNIRGQIMDDFGQYMLSEIQSRFENETGPDGEAWEESTRAKEEGGQTLTDSAILKQSTAYEHSADKLEVGSAMVYAAIHHYGGEIKPKNAKKLMFKIGGHFITTDKVTMPARPIYGFTDQDEEELINIINDHWQGELQ